MTMRTGAFSKRTASTRLAEEPWCVPSNRISSRGYPLATRSSRSGFTSKRRASRTIRASNAGRLSSSRMATLALDEPFEVRLVELAERLPRGGPPLLPVLRQHPEVLGERRAEARERRGEVAPRVEVGDELQDIVRHERRLAKLPTLDELL